MAFDIYHSAVWAKDGDEYMRDFVYILTDCEIARSAVAQNIEAFIRENELCGFGPIKYRQDVDIFFLEPEEGLDDAEPRSISTYCTIIMQYQGNLDGPEDFYTDDTEILILRNRA